MSIELPGNWGKQGPCGEWTVKGTTATGNDYAGALEVTRKTDAFLATWKLDAGLLKSGIGLLLQGMFVVARSSGPAPPGIVWYTLTSDFGLWALWTVPDFNGLLATGIATPPATSTVEGTRSISYFDVNGNLQPPTDLQLLIAQQGAVLNAEWRNAAGTALFKGVGLAASQGLAVAWSAASVASNGLEVFVATAAQDNQGQRADAVCAIHGSPRTGAEWMVRR